MISKLIWNEKLWVLMFHAHFNLSGPVTFCIFISYACSSFPFCSNLRKLTLTNSFCVWKNFPTCSKNVFICAFLPTKHIFYTDSKKALILQKLLLLIFINLFSHQNYQKFFKSKFDTCKNGNFKSLLFRICYMFTCWPIQLFSLLIFYFNKLRLKSYSFDLNDVLKYQNRLVKLEWVSKKRELKLTDIRQRLVHRLKGRFEGAKFRLKKLFSTNGLAKTWKNWTDLIWNQESSRNNQEILC